MWFMIKLLLLHLLHFSMQACMAHPHTHNSTAPPTHFFIPLIPVAPMMFSYWERPQHQGCIISACRYSPYQFSESTRHFGVYYLPHIQVFMARCLPYNQLYANDFKNVLSQHIGQMCYTHKLIQLHDWLHVACSSISFDLCLFSLCKVARCMLCFYTNMYTIALCISSLHRSHEATLHI